MLGKSDTVTVTETSNEIDDYKVNKTEDDELVYQCKACDFNSKSKQGVKQHISRMHKKKQTEAEKSLDLGLIEREVYEELNDDQGFHPPGKTPSFDDFEFQPPSTQADFNLDVTKMFETHEMEKDDNVKNLETSPGQSTPRIPNTVSWRNKYEEKENELTIATVKLAALEQQLREKHNELDEKDETIENYVKKESEHLEQIRVLTVDSGPRMIYFKLLLLKLSLKTSLLNTMMIRAREKI